MKRQSQRAKKKKGQKRKSPATKKTKVVDLAEKPAAKSTVQLQQKPERTSPGKVAEKKGAGDRFIGKSLGKVGQFLREAKMELKKVKWPTRKELLASTAVVIVLTLIVAFFLGLVDFGLIKIIKNIVG
jgi:preprotein translocase subunit SecE